MAKQILLTQGKFALVDDEDFAYLSQWKWHISANRYAARTYRESGKKKILYMHRHISGNISKMHTDHINGDALDNRKSNLRICSTAQNIQNAKKKFGSSKYKGVSWSKTKKKWQVNITHKRKTSYVGRFENEEDAGRAYNLKAIELFGEYARLNII